MSELQTNLSGVEEGQQTESSAKGSYGAPQQNTPPPPAALHRRRQGSAGWAP